MSTPEATDLEGLKNYLAEIERIRIQLLETVKMDEECLARSMAGVRKADETIARTRKQIENFHEVSV